MNGSKAMVKELVAMLNGATLSENVQVAIAPTDLHIGMVRETVRSEIMVGAQDCWTCGSGAFTGETSADMLLDIGAEFSIVGHSERREKGETSGLIGEKAAYAISRGLTVIGCIGEKLEHREVGNTMQIVTEQMEGYLKNLKDESDWASMVLAYEPVWAIGTGVTASPEQAQEIHAELREWLSKNVSPAVAADTRILYGGSVTESNCADLIIKPDIDGFLVGGASLKPQFKAIISSTQ